MHEVAEVKVLCRGRGRSQRAEVEENELCRGRDRSQRADAEESELCRGRGRSQRAEVEGGQAGRRPASPSKWVQFLIALTLLERTGSMPSQARDERQRGLAMRQKQGQSLRRAGAQTDKQEDRGSDFDESDALLPLSVTQATAGQYMKAVEGLVEHLLTARACFTSPQEKDRAIATYICEIARP